MDSEIRFRLKQTQMWFLSFQGSSALGDPTGIFSSIIIRLFLIQLHPIANFPGEKPKAATKTWIWNFTFPSCNSTKLLALIYGRLGKPEKKQNDKQKRQQPNQLALQSFLTEHQPNLQQHHTQLITDKWRLANSPFTHLQNT